jgi:hypothetical protein
MELRLRPPLLLEVERPQVRQLLPQLLRQEAPRRQRLHPRPPQPLLQLQQAAQPQPLPQLVLLLLPQLLLAKTQELQQLLQQLRLELLQRLQRQLGMQEPQPQLQQHLPRRAVHLLLQRPQLEQRQERLLPAAETRKKQQIRRKITWNKD